MGLRLLGFDFETDSLDTASCNIVEIGLAVYDVDLKTVTTCYNLLTMPRNGEVLPDNIVAITGITDIMRLSYGFTHQECADILYAEMHKADFMVGHNALDFDGPILERFINDNHMGIVIPPIIDTLHDVDYGDSAKSKALTYLAADHGFLNPFPHRALFDVLTMFKVLSAYDIGKIAEKCRTPITWILAKVSIAEKDQAKTRGYKFDGTNKFWVKRIRMSSLDGELLRVPFSVVTLPGYKFGEKYK